MGTREEPIVTTVKALLRPDPLEEIRTGHQFKSVDEVYAAAGIKIAAPDIDKALPGAPLYVAKDNVEEIKREIREVIEQVQITTEKLGVVVKADTLGSLEALVKMLEDESITVRKGYSLLLRRQLVISFSDVANVEVIKTDSYNPSRFSHYEDAYEVHINYGSYNRWNYRKYVKIEKTTSERDMLNLADDIRWIIGK